MSRSVLVLGDMSDWESYKRFYDQCNVHFKKYKWIFSEYNEENIFPNINSNNILIFMFFPFKFWDKYIEKQKYNGVYGNVEFYNKFRSFWNQMHKDIKNFYDDKNIYFVNHPLKISIDRDKEIVKTMLNDTKINTPKSYYIKNYNDILKLINEKNKKLFLKVRYGSMGKGITFLSKGNWKTNFKFENNKIISPNSEYNWCFTDITNNISFLKNILCEDIIIEESIESYLFNGYIFDLRVYVYYGQVLYIFPRINNKNAITTNISQGAIGVNSNFIDIFPKQTIDNVIKSAIETTKIVGVNFAGVDIMIDNDLNVYVIELNSFPGFPKIERFNISKKIIDLTEKNNLYINI